MRNRFTGRECMGFAFHEAERLASTGAHVGCPVL
jgi:hypothetical protein